MKAKDRERKKAAAREAIRRVWLEGATAERIAADAKELGLKPAEARAIVAEIAAQHSHGELSSDRYRAMLYKLFADASALGDVKAGLAAVDRIQKLDAVESKALAAAAAITDEQSLIEAVRTGKIDPWKAAAMRPLIAARRSGDTVAAKRLEELAALPQDQLGKLYVAAARRGGNE